MRAARVLVLSTLLTTLTTLVRSEPLNREQIWQSTKHAMVQIKVTGHDASDNAVEPITGTGVIVSESGTIVTALHVVKKDTEWFHYPDGRLNRHIRVTGLSADGVERSLGEASGGEVPGHDIAILHVNGDGFSFVGIDKSVPNPTSSAVAIVWDPSSATPRPVSVELAPTDKGNYGDLLTLNYSVMEGHSGSGIFGNDARLIGVITNKLDSDKALAEPAYAFASLLPPTVLVPNSGVQEAPCKPKGDCDKVVDYDGPPLSTPPEKIITQYPSGTCVESPNGDRLFQYNTEVLGHPAFLSFYQSNGTLKFNSASITIFASFSDFQTTVPINSQYYPAPAMRNGNIMDMKTVCEDAWNELIAILKDKIGPVLDKPIVNNVDVSQPPGCQVSGNCFQKGKDESIEIRFVDIKNIILKRERVTLYSDADDGFGHHTAYQSGNCGVDILVNNPASLK